MTDAKKPSLTELMNMAQKMQEGMRNAQVELEKSETEGGAAGGMVTVKMNGKKRVIKVTITKEAYAEGAEVLADLCEAAFNDASAKVEKMSEEKLKKLTQNIGLPPDFGGAAGGEE